MDYVVPGTIDIGGLNLTPAKTGLLPAMKHKSELLHYGYVTNGKLSVVQCIRPRHSSMTTRLSLGSFSCTPGFRRLIMALYGFSFMVFLVWLLIMAQYGFSFVASHSHNINQ
jgi:hypothetical protein